MDFSTPPRVMALKERLEEFMAAHVYPNESAMTKQIGEGDRWEPIPLQQSLKETAKGDGLWNLFLPDSSYGAGLTNAEYAPLCEVMGRSVFAPEIFNCSAPDTGNMEVLARYGTEDQKAKWLEPLLDARIRSAFAMTEPQVASSDATNVETRLERDGGEYVITGRKWWVSGALDPRCRVLIVMGKTDPGAPRYLQQSMVLVPLPHPGVVLKRALPVFGWDDAPHGHAEVVFDRVRVPEDHVILGEGRGFEIAQGRLGPGRIHHCMRLIGLAERALERMCRRALERSAFGARLSDHGVTRERIAEARIRIDQARLLTLKAAWQMDTVGNKVARKEIAMIKVVAPSMACQVLDWAIQLFGAAGITDDFGLSYGYAMARTLRLADGPDEVHRDQIARLELKEVAATDPERTGSEAAVHPVDPHQRWARGGPG